MKLPFDLKEVVKSLKFLEASFIALTAVVANFAPEYSQVIITALAVVVAGLKIAGITEELATKKWMKEEVIEAKKLSIKAKAVKKSK